MLKFLHIFIALGIWAAVVPAAAAPRPDADIARVSEAWAALKYESGNDPDRLAKVRALKQEAAGLSEQFPAAAELLYWRAQVLCLEAEIMHAMASLDKVGEARELLEKAEKLDPMSSTIKGLLGSLYYEIPGWPLSFGSDKKASSYLQQALALEPDGMDANYFMGDFLLEKANPADAVPYLEKAAQAASRALPSRVVAGRRQDILESIEKARKRLGK